MVKVWSQPCSPTIFHAVWPTTVLSSFSTALTSAAHTHTHTDMNTNVSFKCDQMKVNIFRFPVHSLNDFCVSKFVEYVNQSLASMIMQHPMCYKLRCTISCSVQCKAVFAHDRHNRLSYIKTHTSPRNNHTMNVTSSKHTHKHSQESSSVLGGVFPLTLPLRLYRPFPLRIKDRPSPGL